MIPYWLILSLPILVGSQTANSGLIDEEAALDLASKLFHLVNHYVNNTHALNVDGLYGFRIAEDALLVTIKNLKSSHSKAGRLLTSLVRISSLLDRVCNASQADIEKDDPEYYQSFKLILDSYYKIGDIFHLETLEKPDQHVSGNNRLHKYNETSGDICYQKLIGTYKGKVHQPYKCYIDEDCLELMTRPGQKRYTATHQLLYYTYAQKTGCESLINMALAPETLDSYKRDLCGQILVQNDLLFQPAATHVNIKDIDIFMEQGVVCGMLGFTNFMNGPKLNAVLAYQDPDVGCYRPYVTKAINRMRSALHRDKRRDKLDSDDCQAHATGLAASYMALNLLHQSASPSYM